MTATTTRCRHDMLVIDGKTTCADCLKLPDVPLLDDLGGSPLDIKRNRSGYFIDSQRRNADEVQTFGKCVLCGEPITDPSFATWSPDHADLVGVCCADSDD